MYKIKNDLSAIFYSDLDGTLLNNKAMLSAKSKRYLKELINNGMLFSVASARNLNTISEIAQGIPLTLPVISLNGAYISDIKSMQHLQINAIENGIVSNILEYVDRNKLSMFVSNHKDSLDSIWYYKLSNKGEYWYLKDRESEAKEIIKKVTKLSEFSFSKVTCFTFINRKEKLEELARYFKECYGEHIEMHLFENQYSKGWYWLTIHSHLATKSRAIQYVVEQYGYSDRALTVFGDGTNDIKMFNIADTAVAVKNATSVLKERASFVIGENTEDSVVEYLMQLTSSNRE